MVEFPYIPIEVRNRLDARRYARMGVITVRFGSPDRATEPGGYEFEFSEEDRAVVDQVIADANSADAYRSKSAIDAWAAAIRFAAPTIDAAFLGQPIVADAGSLILDFLGRHIIQPFTVSPGSQAIAMSNGWWSVVITNLTVGEPYVFGAGHRQDWSISASAVLLDWECEYHSIPDTTQYSFPAIAWQADPQGTVSSVVTTGESGTAGNGTVSGDRTNLLGICPSPVGATDWISPSATAVHPNGSGTRSGTYQVGAGGVCFVPTLSSTGFDDVMGLEVCPGEEFDFQFPGDFGAPSDFGNVDEFGDFPLNEDEITQVINCLKDPSCSGNWFPDYSGNPEIDPGGTGGDPGGAPGSDPGGGVIPVPPTPTPDPTDPDAPDPDGPIDPDFPTPGGTPVDDFKLNDGVGKQPVAKVRSPEFPSSGDPNYDDFKPGKPFCVNMDGQQYCGKVSRYEPPPLGGDGPELPGGDVVGEFPPFGDETFTKDRCYPAGKPVVEIVAELAAELGLNPDTLLVDESCTATWPGGCFKAGSSKFDAMWRAADMCGFGVFPSPCELDPTEVGCGEIGPIEPLDIHHGPYHEHRDLFLFAPVSDSLDIPRWVVYWQAPTAGDPGSGFEVRVQVVSDYVLPDDKEERIQAPIGMTEASAITAAAARAATYALKTSLTEFAVPLRWAIDKRHQIETQQPSKGLNINYMVWEFEHDAVVGEGFITKVRGVELERTRYGARFEPYSTVWAGEMN